jgi:hypothetical protein
LISTGSRCAGPEILDALQGERMRFQCKNSGFIFSKEKIKQTEQIMSDSSHSPASTSLTTTNPATTSFSLTVSSSTFGSEKKIEDVHHPHDADIIGQQYKIPKTQREKLTALVHTSGMANLMRRTEKFNNEYKKK